MGFSILKEEFVKRGKTLKFTPEQLKNPQVVVKKFYDFFLRGEFSFTHEELHHALKVVYKGEFTSLCLKDLTEAQMKGLRWGVGAFDLDETQVYPFVFETRLTGSESGSGTLEVIEYIFADKAGYRDGLTRYSRFLGGGEAYRVLNPFRLVVLSQLFDLVGEDAIERFVSDEEASSRLRAQYVFQTLSALYGGSRDLVRPRYYGDDIRSQFVVSLADRLLGLYREIMKVVQQREYDYTVQKEHARLYTTKVRIPAKIQKAMAATPLREYFRFIELDGDVDLEKFAKVEEMVLHIVSRLPRPSQQSELRFRKMGNYRAVGVYYPPLVSIVVDARNTTSFVHEYGHYLDRTLRGEDLSLSKEFAPLLAAYQKNLGKVPFQGGLPSAEMMGYWQTPTEAFARGFELYIRHVLRDKSLPIRIVMDTNAFRSGEYLAWTGDKKLYQVLIRYFASVLPLR